MHKDKEKKITNFHFKKYLLAYKYNRKHHSLIHASISEF